METCAEMQVCRGQEKDALRMYEKILQLDADNLAANIFLGNYYYFSLFPSVCSHFTDTFSIYSL